MFDHNVLADIMKTSDPVWTALDNVYNSVDGDAHAKSLEVAEIVSKYALYEAVINLRGGSNVEETRRKAGSTISAINERYPFNVTVCLSNVTRALRTYDNFHATILPLAEVDDFLTLLLRGNDLDKVSDATESIKDKIYDKVKSMFHIFNKDKKNSKAKIDKTDEKLNVSDKKKDAELSSGKEDDNAENGAAIDNDGGQTTNDIDGAEPMEDSNQSAEQTNARAQAHELAWEVLCNVYRKE